MDASYCLCGQPYDPNIFMIQCDICKDWFHGSCCNFQEHTAIEIDKYHCPRCAPICGPSQYKSYKNFHRHNYWDGDALDKPVQTGTEVFIRELRARHFNSEGEVVLHMRGQQLTDALLTQKGFDNPIVIDGKDGLDMTIPPDNFSLYDVESYIGGDFEMDVIDVTRQMDIKMKLRDFIGYFNSLNRTRVFNVVSLEFSKTGLSRMVEAPLVARKLDWVSTVWPRDYPLEKPHVQKYCLMSVKDSYTDFHIDFGGTSVWYHILRGEKIFYFIKPTPANLTLYQQWMTSSNQSETFFGDQVDQCFKCTLRQGQTMLIPTGWIHAVLTPIDSLVFGGNFLHSLNIRMQLQVYDIEKKIKTASKFLYPFFETINWFAAQKLLQQLTELNADERKCPANFLSGLKTLVVYLKQWNTDKDYNTLSREQVPVGLNVPKLFKDISKEVRHAERYINSLNPPKPERESKRKRKKPVNKDFVDYSLSKASLEFMTADSIPIKEAPKAVKIVVPKPASYPYERQAFFEPEDVVESITELDWDGTLEQTTAVHRGGAVLKIKLGSKDIIPIDAAGMKAEEVELSHLSKSIYDFHDDSDREEDCFLSIDESPKVNRKVKVEDIKPKLSPWSLIKKEPDRLDIGSKIPKNGIESLLKASALTGIKIENEDGRASPSTQEAIAGMLSISQTYISPSKSSKARKTKRARMASEDDEDDLSNVHQDEDYIYPSLDNSDEEEDLIFKRGRSTRIDEPWNPKARVGPLLPKMNRPAREGTKKQSVEKVLEAAAKRTINESADKSPKRQYRKKKTKQKIPEKVQVAPSTSTAGPSISSTSSASSSSSTPMRPRKGMKTVKQRLGKILKIHKMMH